jgi:hypothetical protein
VITSSTAAGIGASMLLVLVECAFGDDLDPIEHAAVGAAVMGVALTGHGIYRGGATAQAAAVYWTIAATASMPAVLLWWAQRKRRNEQALAKLAGAIAGSDYRARPPQTEAENLR